MAVIKCKMCGGDIDLAADKTFGTCEYCGSTMTLPKVDDEQRASAFNRGNHFRRIGEFDKALAVYERIVAENESDAEAHWCCALCRFGIEYVEDPATYEWIPTCHRASFDSFLEDVDYLAALEYSDGLTKRQYQKDAVKIADVQRGILATSQKEEPFDVFLCYKESDDNGERTVDSTLAQDIYYQLKEQGRRVFFARITLEDKGGAEYEPYIFAALHSAKVMLVVGTKPEYFNAVWVKNEWSRFLGLMKKDHSKLLLPCYRDMDPYDLPEQLSVLQSYDMSKIGFIQDLIRGVNKVLDAGKKEDAAIVVQQTTVQSSGNANVAALVKRGNMALEDGEWGNANGYFDRALDMDAECGEAYLGKALAEYEVNSLDQYQSKCKPVLAQIEAVRIKVEIPGHEQRIRHLAAQYEVPVYLSASMLQQSFEFDFYYSSKAPNFEKMAEIQSQWLTANKNLYRAEMYADEALKREITAFKDAIQANMEQTRGTIQAEDAAAEENIKARYEQAMVQWEKQIAQKHTDAESHREKDYQTAVDLFERGKFDHAAERFQTPGLTEYRETADYIEKCKKAIADQQAAQKREAALRSKKHKTIGVIIGAAAAASFALILVVVRLIIPGIHYNRAEALLSDGQYEEAAAAYVAAGDYKDAPEQITECYYQRAAALLENGQYDEASTMFDSLGDYNDAAEQALNCYYQQAVALLQDEQYEEAISAFKKAGDYSDAAQRRFDLWANISRDRISRDIISCGYNHTIGLKADGTVVAVGNNNYGQCDVSDWENVVAVNAGFYHTIGLKEDGTVVAVGSNSYGRCDVFDWENIVAVNAEVYHTIGLKADGTVVAVGSNTSGQCDVFNWENIVAVDAGYRHTIGLREDGTVVAVGSNYYGQCDVSDWENVVAVNAGGNHTIGLKEDGTVVAVGNNNYGQCDVSDWENIVAVNAGYDYTLGLKADGTVVAVGNNDDGQCDVSGWVDIKIPE